MNTSTKLPTIKQLRYFIALEKHQHFGNAAKSCFVSQSAFSVAIKELESQLGAQLVDRTNKSVTITRTGREIALYLREDTTQNCHDLLIDGELDLIMVALPYKLSNVEVLPLFKDPF